MVFLSLVGLAAPVFLTGCPIPPPLESEGPDAAPNSPPVILAASPDDFAIPGPLILDRGDQRRMVLTIIDNDISDTSYVYFYRDYFPDNPTPSLSSCNASAEEATRIAECSTATLCTGVGETDQGDHLLEALVADAELLGEGEPAFRSFPDGVTPTRVAWIMRCNPPPQ